MSNIYGVAHFAKQNAVPQVEWKNVDIIGQYIDNLNKQKQLEMMDKSYELAKDQAAFAREKFGYDQERDKVKDGQWEKAFAFNASEAEKNRQANFDLEKMKYEHKLRDENRELQNLIDIFTVDAQTYAKQISTDQDQVRKYYLNDDYTAGNKLAEGVNSSRKKFHTMFGFDVEELDKILKDPILSTRYAKVFASHKVNPNRREY